MDYREALEHLSDAEYQYQAKFNLGICERRKGELESSIKFLKQATEMQANRPTAFNNLGLSYFEFGEFEEALLNYGKAINLDPTPVHYNNRGLAFYHFDRLEEAKEDFDEAIRLDHMSDKPDPTIYFNRGNVLLNWKPQQNFEGAHEDYDQALNISPSNAKLWHSKGLAFQGQAEFEFK